MAITKTSKLHVNPEIAELVKIYCVLHDIKMADFTTSVLENELKYFREELKNFRRVDCFRKKFE